VAALAAAELRKTGISAAGDVPWGTHFCHFYETKEDLLDILIPYFKAGLENNEFCMWVVFDPLDEEKARDALRRFVPDAERHLAEGRIEIVPHARWYLQGGAFDLRRVIKGWEEKLGQALARDYEGMRVNGNESWLTEDDWKNFTEYEDRLNRMIAGQRMIVLCTYPLAKTKAGEVFDVARTHQFAVAKRRGRWEVIETPELKRAKTEIERLNEELERRVVERTAELAAANEELKTEIAERKRAEGQLMNSRQQLRDLTARLQSLREQERAHIAREIHDVLGQGLTGLKIDASWLRKRLPEAGDEAVRADMAGRLNASIELLDETIATVKNLSAELRPRVLDTFGLAAAVEWQCYEFGRRTGIACECHLPEDELPLGAERSTALFRIYQETLTNVARHAQATKVFTELSVEGGYVLLRVRDNGRGVTDEEAAAPEALGLLGMRERAALLGGDVSIQGRPGKGTVVTARVPVGEPPL
jgi:signal transduction histidine kinase